MDKTEKQSRRPEPPVPDRIGADEPLRTLFGLNDWLAFGVAFIIALVVFTYTLAPTVTLEDSGELAVAADYLGVPHPPGYPVWTMLAWLFQLIFHWMRYCGQPNPAWGVGFLSAFFGALLAGNVALLVSRSGLDMLRFRRHEEDLPSTGTEKIISWASGVAAGLLLAFCPFIWSQAVIAEVYTMNAFLHVLVMTLLYAWMRRPRANKLLYWMAFVFGITFTNCQPIVLLIPAIVLVLFATDRRLCRDCVAGGLIIMGAFILFSIFFPQYAVRPFEPRQRWIFIAVLMLVAPAGIWLVTRELFTEWRRVLVMVLCVGLGLSLFVYLPIASDFNPPMNWGYPRTWEGFKHAVMRGQYQALAPALSPMAFIKQSYEFCNQLEDQFPFPIAFLALIPIFYFRHIWRKNWAWLSGTLIGFAFMGPGMMVLLNPAHDVQSLFIAEVQFVQSTSVYAIWLGYGLLFGLAFIESVFSRKLMLVFGIIITLLLPLTLIWQNQYDEKIINSTGGNEQRGHDFGWQFGNYQLRGIKAIMEELKPGETPPPNPAYPPEMEPNAIFYGGTDPGRFVPTYMIYSAKVRSDVFLITQNALADNTYMNVMRDLYGDLIWIPTPQDTNRAFQTYVEDVRAGRIPANAAVTVDKSGKVSVQGVQGVMEINGIISKAIFEANKNKHAFYIEESYVIAWMYPYLEPHGLIMKINPEPLPALTPEMIKNDMDFWNWYANRLLSDKKFQRDAVARKSFSKLRCAIAGLYSYRRLQKEAEAAFRQAINLFPGSPEANFRLADLYLQYNRFSEALQVMEKNLEWDPRNGRIVAFINQIKDMEQVNTRINELQNELARGGGTLDHALELTALYLRANRDQQFADLSRQVLGNTNLPPQICLKIAEIAMSVQPQRLGMVAEAYQHYLARERSDPRVWHELGCVQIAIGQPSNAIHSLQQAVAIGGEPIKDVLRKDQRLEPLRASEAIQKLLAPAAQQKFTPFPGIIPP
ncbi:MAG: DUF2723 domain-containing protein [Kiritimatiellia bacterium]|nr:DUF2723 domain-containing protein [Kiritimatiellia bacterium]